MDEQSTIGAGRDCEAIRAIDMSRATGTPAAATLPEILEPGDELVDPHDAAPESDRRDFPRPLAGSPVSRSTARRYAETNAAARLSVTTSNVTALQPSGGA